MSWKRTLQYKKTNIFFLNWFSIVLGSFLNYFSNFENIITYHPQKRIINWNKMRNFSLFNFLNTFSLKLFNKTIFTLTANLNHLKTQKWSGTKNKNTSRFGTVGYTQPNDSLLFRVEKKTKKSLAKAVPPNLWWRIQKRST